MAYVKQDWVDEDSTKPINAVRLNHIEDGIYQASLGGGGSGGNLDTLNGTTVDGTSNYRLILFDNGTVKAIPYATPDPGPPSNLTGTALKLSSVTFTWSAGTGVGIKYGVFRNGGEIAQVTQRSYKDATVVTGQTYQYKVQTIDVYGQRSPFSDPINAFINPALNQNPIPAIKIWPTDGYPINGKLKVRIDATDPDAQALIFALTADGGTLTPDPGPDNDPTVWWYTP